MAILDPVYFASLVNHGQRHMTHEELQQLVDEQALDEGLWFIAETGPEAYLQQELRRLHTAIESSHVYEEPTP